MKRTFRFDAVRVRELLKHSQGCRLHEPTLGQSYEKFGDRMMREQIPQEEKDALRKQIEPGLWLVKDDGLYLMSNGNPRMPLEPQGSNVAYAEGFSDKDLQSEGVYEALRVAVGGDDFVEYLSFALFAGVEDPSVVTVVMTLTEKNVSVRLEVSETGARLALAALVVKTLQDAKRPLSLRELAYVLHSGGNKRHRLTKAVKSLEDAGRMVATKEEDEKGFYRWALVV